MGQSQPLVSIISFCRNRSWTIRRSVESVLGQSYSNIEFVIQDGASTDGTAEILREYAARDRRIKLISEPDSGPAEAFWKVLHRCQGEIIGTCLSDEELLPDAVEKAVKSFHREPHLGAITGDGYITDAEGKITGDFIAGEFDFVNYLFGRYCPFWPGSFFRRKALIDVGFLEPGWNMDCIEFEIWCRLAMDHEVKYFPGPVSKYAIHPEQASNTPANFNEHIQGRLALVEKMFSAEGFFGPNEILKLECMINQLNLFHFHAQAYRLVEEEKKFGRQIADLSRRLAAIDDGSVSFRRRQALIEELSAEEQLDQIWAEFRRTPIGLARHLLPVSGRTTIRRLFKISGTLAMTGRLPTEQLNEAAGRAHYLWARLSLLVPGAMRRKLPVNFKLAVRRRFAGAFRVIRYLPAYALLAVRWMFFKGTAEKQRTFRSEESHKPLHVYPVIALIYDARGQIGQALEMWRRAEPLKNPFIDSFAGQAILKLPTATYQDIGALQRRWAENHARVAPANLDYEFRAYERGRRIRVGYHCSFMESDTIRFIMRNVLQSHDRSEFEIFGYSPVPLSNDIKSAFDTVRHTSALSDAMFVKCVRKDQIDVFVEMTGFSPGHRYVAMASRCAPVQISYLNHHGTSCIEAVDYFLSDDISTPQSAETDNAFTESIYRLPHCLLCYDYGEHPHPPVSDPPSITRGYVTFGCFGSGSKINTDLIELWAELLKKVPDSILYLRNAQLTAPENRRFMVRRFGRFGVGAERLRLDGGTDRDSLLRCYADVDIGLDTWPYCGGNSIAEPLWQGVPVVTLLGGRISSRYGASLLAAAGCTDLIAEDRAGYLNICKTLAEDGQRLVQLRHSLRRMCKEHGLGDSKRFAGDLEVAYREMLTRRWRHITPSRSMRQPELVA